jgi:hypothetical protein
MKNNALGLLTPGTLALVFILLVDFNPVLCQVNKGWTHLKYSIFFTHNDLKHLLSNDAQFRETMSYFAPVKIEKAYLEGNSRGDEEITLMKKISERFRAVGIKTAGAMVPVSEKGGPMCYNNPDDLAALEKRMRALATIFDEIILDDWLFTICHCEKCVTDRGNLSWADYRTKLILEKSKQVIINPAKEVNPQVKVIIKYPNWYEGHRQNGYDVYNETILFDKMAVGIETRIPETQDQHIPIYSGYVFQKWWASVAPSKWVGSWLDNYDMQGGADDYNAQVWQAVMAQTPEIILWCAGQLYPPNPSSDVYPHFVNLLPEFDKVAGMLKGSSRGIPIYLPYGSTGEYNIFGYFGMIGIPLTPVAEFPTESQNAIFTLHSLQDLRLAAGMIKRLRDGHDVFMTWALWKKLGESEFKNTFSLIFDGGSITSSEFRIREGWHNQIIKADKPFTFPRIETTTWPGVRDVAVIEEDYDMAVFLKTQYLNGTIYVLNMPDNSYDLQRLPTEALTAIRRAFSKELGFTLKSPGNVGSYLFGQKQYVLYNMGDKEAPVSLRFTENIATSGWRELLHGKELLVKEDTSWVRFNRPIVRDVSLAIKPFEIVIVEAP